MQQHTANHALQPRLPVALAWPIKMLPSFVHNRALLSTLNQLFKQDISDGELDFLQGKVIHIAIEDAGIDYHFTFSENKLAAVTKNRPADLVLKGTIYNYLLLASRQEDTDTLFFSRRLTMQGDTELGLYVKNFLDGMDMDSMKVPAYLETLLQKSLPVYEKLFG